MIEVTVFEFVVLHIYVAVAGSNVSTLPHSSAS